MAQSSVSLPGFASPGVGFEQPFEMLEACHERVQRSLALLQRLVDHVDRNGHDADSRSAARDVLRYFDIAAPLHHEDEELHVFPPLLERGGADTVAAVRQLQQDHEAMSANWQAARALLQALAEGSQDSFSAPDEALLARFAGVYAEHIRLEEDLVYPAARALLAPEAAQAMGAEMRRRRGAAG